MSGLEHNNTPARSSTSAAPAVIAVGFSAGGLGPLLTMLDGLATDIGAAVVIAHHARRSFLPELVNDRGRWPASFADSGETIRAGRLYVCPSRHHLIVNPDGTMSTSRLERVNFARPSIDWLFESASVSFRDRMVAVVLSGGQSDGARGVSHVHAHGGRIVVQDPFTARHPGMPEAAICASVPKLVVSPEDLAKAVEFQLSSFDLPRTVAEWDDPFHAGTFAA